MTSPTTESFPRSTRFTFRRRLGAGGFGVVYEAEDRERRTRVALKTLQQLDAAALYAFKREFRALCDVVHKNLVALHDLISEDDRWFFTMDLIEGTDFVSFVRDRPASAAASTVLAPLRASNAPPTPDAALLSTVDATDRMADAASPSTVDRASDVVGARDRTAETGGPSEAADLQNEDERWSRLRAALRQLTEGILALHDAGKLHRDLKPSNVLVARDCRVVILDFGLVADVSRGPAHPSIGATAGTPAYMAPEQALGEPASPANDWYSVGVMLYEALTGRLPFEGAPLQILLRKQKEDPVPPSSLDARIPSDLEDLCLQLMRRTATQRPGGLEVLDRLATRTERTANKAADEPSRRDSIPFVGRQEQLGALHRAFERVKGGEATVVHVRGVSGMGKSALVQRFLQETESKGDAVILQGRCYERESVPYKAVDNLIDSLSRYLSRLPGAKAAEVVPRDVQPLVRIFPVLDRVKAIADAPRRGHLPPDVQELRKRAFGALRELFGRIADRQPLVLYIDDLQWGDADSALLLGDLVRQPDAPALLLLIGYRSEDAEKSEMLQRLPMSVAAASGHGASKMAAGDAVINLDVGPLDAGEGRMLARHVLGASAKAEHVEAIVQEAAGSPFFVQALAQAAAERTDFTGGAIRLDLVLGELLSRLPLEARSLLQIVAVAGKPLSRNVAREASGLAPEKERAAMGVLRAEHILRSRGVAQEEELETFHDRIREATISQLDAAELVQHHLRLAMTLEASGKADADMLALHFRRAERPDKAVPYAILAGDRAAKALAFDRAAAIYTYALETAPGDEEHERSVRIRLADALRNAGRGAAAAKEYSLAARGAPAEQSLDLRRQAAEQLLRSGHLREGEIALRDVLASIGVRLFQNGWLVLLSLLFWRIALRLRGLRPRARPTATPPKTLARMDACWAWAVGFTMTDMIRGAEFSARHLWLALRTGEPHHVARGLALEAAHQSAARGGVDRGRAIHRIAAGMTPALSDPYLVGFKDLALAAIELNAGNWTACIRAGSAAEEQWLGHCAGVAWELATVRWFVTVARFLQGEIGEMCRFSHVRLEDALQRGDLFASSGVRLTSSFMRRLAEDDAGAALADVNASMSAWPQGRFDQFQFTALVSFSRVEIYKGDPLSARQRFKDAFPKVARSSLLRMPIYRASHDELRASAALAAAAEQTDKDSPRFNVLLREAERDAEAVGREPLPWATPLSNLRRSGVAYLRGDRESAISLLALALSGLERCDMRLHAASARRRKGELVGGEEGRALVEAADAWMVGQGIKNPARMAALFAPGFSRMSRTGDTL